MRLSKSGVGCVDRKGQASPHLLGVLKKKKMLVRSCALGHIVIRVDGGFFETKRCVTSCIVRTKIERP